MTSKPAERFAIDWKSPSAARAGREMLVKMVFLMSRASKATQSIAVRAKRVMRSQRVWWEGKRWV